jgi:hypothetical protein
LQLQLQLQGGIRDYGHLLVLVSLSSILGDILGNILDETLGGILGDTLGDILAKYGTNLREY